MNGQNRTPNLVDVYPYRLGETAEPEFLILKRSGKVVYAGQWRMIGGKVVQGETAWEAALRELEEEAGTGPLRFWVLPSLNHFYDPKNDRIRLIPAFAAQLPHDAEIRLDEEHTEYRWIANDRIDSYIAWPEQQRLMQLTSRIVATNRILDEWEIEV